MRNRIRTRNSLDMLLEMILQFEFLSKSVLTRLQNALRLKWMINWETSTYGKVKYCEDIGYFRNFETDFPTIVYEDALAYDHEISSKPKMSMKWFTLRYENKEYVLDEQIPTINDDSTQEEIKAHKKHYDDANKVSCIMASSRSPELQKTFKKQLEMKGYFDRLESLNMVFDAELSFNTILSGLPADYNQILLLSFVVDCWSQCKKRKTSHSNWKGKAAQGKSDRGSKRKAKSEIAPTSDPKEAVCFYCNTKGELEA
ncbi:hypothetical protein Tco_0673099 [Tanacetum coccineum]